MSTTSLTADRLDDLLTATTTRPLVLDVRSPAEYESARLPGSLNVPLGDLKRQRDDLAGLSRTADPSRSTVVVCQSGGRATEAAELMTGAGVPDVHVLDGGVAAWRASGRKVDTGRGAWEIERQVRLVAGSIVLTSILASTVVPGAKWVAAGIGTGLTGAALTNTCAMGALLAKAPWNTRTTRPTTTLAEAYRA